MEPLRGLAGQISALERSLRLLLGLLLPCLLLLLLLSALLLLRWRLCRRVGAPSAARGPSTPPRLLPGAPKAAVVRHDPGDGTARRQLAQTRGAAPTGPAGPRAPCCGRKAALSYLPGSSPRLLRLERGAPPSFNDLEKHPVLVPPNSPVTSSGTGGVLERVFSSCHTSTQRKPRSCSQLASGTHSSTGPFEFGSSIRPGDRRAHLNSANYTASQGPGLDSYFGASAGISVRILSTDSEGSPNTPLVHPQQAELFEWDYYDPSYKRRAQLHRSLPPICSKQYWL
ncbi:protein huluwa-like [Crotalus tigris]|uniref:protein huluwa-like n=1 Tax=Crotalus tigris TaxID=88082 RepID=UPI00192F8486|nr:protein huluwa-like [Crotalus tigris]